MSSIRIERQKSHGQVLSEDHRVDRRNHDVRHAVDDKGRLLDRYHYFLTLLLKGLYNHPEVVVEKAERTDIAARAVSWGRSTFVSVVMVCLVLTLATRTFHGTTYHSVAVHSNSPQAMRQHMDRDAFRWAAPVAKVTVLLAPTFYPRVAPAGPPIPTLLIEENLYNRPPPTC